MTRVKAGRQYVVGFSGKNQPSLYSKSAWANAIDHEGGIDKMTYNQAKKHLKKLYGKGAEVAIFELKPVYKEIIRR